MLMLGGAIVRLALTCAGGVMVSVGENRLAASGIGLTHPFDRARWNREPICTRVPLSSRNEAHWVRMSRSPGYLAPLALQVFQTASPCSISPMAAALAWIAMPHMIHSSREQSGLIADKAETISSHEVLVGATASSTVVDRSDCHRSSRASGITGRRVQWPLPAQR